LYELVHKVSGGIFENLFAGTESETKDLETLPLNSRDALITEIILTKKLQIIGNYLSTKIYNDLVIQSKTRGDHIQNMTIIFINLLKLESYSDLANLVGTNYLNSLNLRYFDELIRAILPALK